MKLKTGIPRELVDALYPFLQKTGEIREAIGRDDSAVAQDLINIVANLTAVARAMVPTVLSPTGQAPVMHFVSTLFVPPGYVWVTKNDLILWSGPIARFSDASLNGNWPSGTTAHLAPQNYADIMDHFASTNVRVKR